MKVLRQQSHTIFLSSLSPDIDDNHVEVASYFQFVTETIIPPTLLLQSLHRVLTKFILSFSFKIDTHMVTNYSLSYFQNLACQFHFFRGKFKKQTNKEKKNLQNILCIDNPNSNCVEPLQAQYHAKCCCQAIQRNRTSVWVQKM